MICNHGSAVRFCHGAPINLTMPHPSDLTKQVIDRLMNLKEFTIKVRVEDNWLPVGIVPFNIHIKDNIATVTIPALTEEEAKEKVAEYFGSDDFV